MTPIPPWFLKRKWVTPHEVALLLSVSRRTIFRMLKDGRLPPPARIGYNNLRINPKDVVAFLKRSQNSPYPRTNHY